MATTRQKGKSVSGENKDDIDAKLQQILTRLDDNKKSNEKQFNNLLTQINKVSNRLEKIENEQLEFSKALDFANADIDSLKSDVQQLQATVFNLQRANQNMQAQDDLVAKSVDDMLNEKNKKALIMANIPESRHEDLSKITSVLASKLDVDIKEHDIESVFRIKSEKSPNPAHIMVKFHSATVRDKLYNARKLFKKKSVTTKSLGYIHETSIYINEVLSKSQQALFYKARQFKQAERWKYCWTYHGNIFLRISNETDPVKIMSEDTLSQLLKTKSQNG